MAQLLREALAPDSFESFRALSLDASARLREADRVIGDVKSENVPRVALEPIIDELIWSFGSDPALRLICADELEIVKKALKSSSTRLDDLQYYIRHVALKAAPHYQDKLEELIICHINEGRKIELRRCVITYISHLINSGYSRSFLVEQVEKTFFDREFNRTGSAIVRGFLRRFDGKENKFIVTVGVNRTMALHLRNIHLRVERGPDKLPDFVEREILQESDQKYRQDFLFETIPALDPYSAGRRASTLLKNIRSVAMMAADGSEFSWNDKIFVYKTRAQSGQFIAESTVSGRVFSVPPARSRSLRSARQYSEKVFSFPARSSSRIIRAIDTAIASHEASSTESRLTAYWSAVEVFFAAPDPSRARILHYVDLIAPCICLKYANRMLLAIHNALLVSYRRRFSAIIAEVREGAQYGYAASLASILVLEKYRDQRDRLFQLIANSPLALHRVWVLADMLKTPESYMSALSSHESRIRWQIHRIYRARNSIAHAGSPPTFLDSLTLNLAEYFQTVLGVVTEVRQPEPAEQDIDQGVADIAIKYSVQIARLAASKKEPWSEDLLYSTVSA